MAEIKFEDGLKRLEKIVEELEEGDISLDEALGKYEEGIRLSKLCAKKLELAKKKIEILMKSEDGSVHPVPFNEEELSAKEKPRQETKKRRPKEGKDLV